MKLCEVAGILILLLLCSITDIKEKKIYIFPCIIFMVIGIIMEFMIGQRGILSICIGMLPGIFVYMAGIITREGIGKGDALVFIVIGIFMGLMKCMILLICSLFLIAGIGVILLFIRKGNLKTKIPFVPFITVSFMIIICMGTF